jgi:hypothetical protein
MSATTNIDEGPSTPSRRAKYREWYAEFGAKSRIDSPLEQVRTIREWYAHFGAGIWDREFEDDVAAGRLDWLAVEARKDLSDVRCTDR